MNKKENQQQWSKKIEEFKRSGKSKEEWCKKNNISLRQFNYWLRQFTGEDTATHWLPVEISQEKNSTELPLQIKICPVTVDVYPGFDKEFLLDVLTTLKAL